MKQHRRVGFQNSLTHESVEGSGIPERGDDKVSVLQPDGTPVPRARKKGITPSLQT